MFDIILLQSLWAVGFLISSHLLTISLLFIGLRFLIAGLFFLGYRFFSGERLAITLFDWFLLCGLAAALAVKYIGKFFVLQMVQPPILAFFYNATPVITALFNYAWYRVALQKHEIIGISIALFSLFLIVDASAIYLNDEHLSITSFIIFLLVSIIIPYSWSHLTMKQILVGKRATAAMINGVRKTGAGIMLTALACWIEPLPTLEFCPELFLLLGGLFLVNYLLAPHLYLFVLSRYPATVVAMSDFLYPFLLAIFSVLYEDASFTLQQLIGSIISVIGFTFFCYGDSVLIWLKQPRLARS